MTDPLAEVRDLNWELYGLVGATEGKRLELASACARASDAGATLRELSEILGLSRQRVHQLIKQGREG